MEEVQFKGPMPEVCLGSLRGKLVVDEVIGMMEGGLVGLIDIVGLDSE